MLSELTIKNFAIIDDVRIKFNNGLTVLTGETGAGKSIIIEAVNLILGSRASHELIRTGHESAELEAFFEISPGSPQAKIMADQGIDYKEGLIIRRIISSKGKHKVYINSRQSSMQLLKELCENLAGISSQHAHQGLLKEKNHLDVLDEFCNLSVLRKETEDIFNDLIVLIKKLEKLRASKAKSTEERDFLKFQINEIEQLNIGKNEDADLEREQKRLKNASQICEIFNFSINELYAGEGSVTERLSAVKSGMEKYKDVEPVLKEKALVIENMIFELKEMAEDFRVSLSKIDPDTTALEKVENRLDQLQKLKRKYGGSLDSLFAQYKLMQDQFSKTCDVKGQIVKLEKQVKNLKTRYGKNAAMLSEKRKKGAKHLASLVETELHDLEMNQARFIINIDNAKGDPGRDLFTMDGAKAFPTGIDNVSFYISPNPGEKAKPLAKIVSGGELSRIVLALKIILSRTDFLETLIFDEVDAGIGGATSEKVGIKLAGLGKNNQVICITHLAQIARYGKNHYKIAKSVSRNKTLTTIIPLMHKDEKADELARMIGGSKITRATLDHAREMVKFTEK